MKPSIKLIVWLSGIAFVLSATSSVLWLLGVNNLFTGHIYTPIQFILIVCIYQLTLKSISSKWFIALNILFVTFSILNTVYLQPLSIHNSYARTISSIILVGLSILYFQQALQNPTNHQAEKIPMFWFNSGVLLYFFCTLF
ncbi:MAG: hypothetical protein ACPGJS_15850, partial [Flammeovirgaceae bacterium]